LRAWRQHSSRAPRYCTVSVTFSEMGRMNEENFKIYCKIFSQHFIERAEKSRSDVGQVSQNLNWILSKHVTTSYFLFIVVMG
jgi:hypothetical protein